MARAQPAAGTVRVSIRVTSEQKQALSRRAGDAGQSLSAYVRDCFRIRADPNDELLHFMVEELAEFEEKSSAALALAHERNKSCPSETPEARDSRVAAEIRASLQNADLHSLGCFLAPAFTVGL